MNIIDALIQLWLIAIFFMCVSYLFKKNAFFTATMQMLVGLLAANYIVVGWSGLISTVYFPLTTGNYIPILFLLTGLLMFSVFSKKLSWIGRYPSAIMTGAGVGLILRSVMYTDVLNQIALNILPIVTNNITTSLGNGISMVSLILSLFYFTFGFEIKSRPMKLVTRIGRIFIMVAFGTTIWSGILNGANGSVFGIIDFASLKQYWLTFLRDINII